MGFVKVTNFFIHKNPICCQFHVGKSPIQCIFLPRLGYFLIKNRLKMPVILRGPCFSKIIVV
jgi:hypothetical protein